MNTKTPVSLLQEYAVKAKLCMPDYKPESGDVPGYSFKCTVKIGDVVASGYGTTKQTAKHDSAKNALQQFGISLNFNAETNNNVKIVSPTGQLLEPPRNQVNYVGILNEIASTHRKSYPTYDDVVSLSPFQVTCSFLKWNTEGFGLTKKAAKQESAQKMLQLVRNEKDILSIPDPRQIDLPDGKNEDVDKMTERVQAKLKEMSLYPDRNVDTAFDDIIPQIIASSPIKTLKELQDELKNNGHQSEIETLQSRPCIMMLRIQGRSCVVMGQGKNKQDALTDLFQVTLLMFVKGYNFRSSFEDVPTPLSIQR